MIQIREMQVRDTDAVAEIERQIFSQPWSRQGFLDAVNLGNTVSRSSTDHGLGVNAGSGKNGGC